MTGWQRLFPVRGRRDKMLRQLFFLRKPAESGGRNYAYPTEDLEVGNWTPSTGSSLYACVDEDPYSDSDYISLLGADSSLTRSCYLKLGALTDPGVNTGHKLSIRWHGSPEWGKREECYFLLYQDSTEICRIQKWLVETSVFTTEEHSLSEAEANRITDYTKLKVRILSVSIADHDFHVSWIRFEVPE